MATGIPIVLTTRSPHGRATATYAFAGGGARWLAAGAILAGPLGGPKARIALALGLGRRAGCGRTASPLRAVTRPPDLIVLGRIASLAGEEGFGWLEGLAVLDGRIVAAGRRHDIVGLAGAGTRTMELAPGQVALPSVTDAHLHLVDAALAADEVDLEGSATLEVALRAHRARRHGAPGRWRPRWLAAGTWLGDGPMDGAADGRRSRARGARPSDRPLVARSPHDVAERGGAGRRWHRGLDAGSGRGRGRPRRLGSSRWPAPRTRDRPHRRRRPSAERGGDRRCGHAIRTGGWPPSA